MSKLELYELAQLANNSRVTNEVLTILNAKLKGSDLRIFREWLRIIREKK